MYDCCLGRPPLHLRRAFQRQIKEVITGCEREDGYTWPMVFKVLGVPCPSRPTLLAKLERAVRNSEEKEYHRAGMDFSRLQKSGVSKILLKGESYSAPPNMKKVRMHERWRFSGHDRVYLDASCLAYDFAGKVIKVVDYQHQTAFSMEMAGRGGVGGYGAGGHGHGRYARFANSPAIRHSGDEIDDVQRTGEHTIDIDVARLPPHVAALYFTVSAWTTTLGEILQPSVHLVGDGDVELCAYELEQQNTGENTAVVMCKLFREVTGASKWQLKAIGHVGMGRASGGHVDGETHGAGGGDPYRPIKDDIRNKDL